MYPPSSPGKPLGRDKSEVTATRSSFSGTSIYIPARPTTAAEWKATPAAPTRQPLPDSRLEAPGSRLQARGSRLQAPGSRLQAPGSRLEAPGSRLSGGPREKTEYIGRVVETEKHACVGAGECLIGGRAAAVPDEDLSGQETGARRQERGNGRRSSRGAPGVQEL